MVHRYFKHSKNVNTPPLSSLLSLLSSQPFPPHPPHPTIPSCKQSALPLLRLFTTVGLQYLLSSAQARITCSCVSSMMTFTKKTHSWLKNHAPPNGRKWCKCFCINARSLFYPGQVTELLPHRAVQALTTGVSAVYSRTLAVGQTHADYSYKQNPL